MKLKQYYKLPNGIECKQVVGEFPYNIGTAIAYLWRAGKKQPENPGQSMDEKTIEDLNKAIDHIRFEIERIAEAARREKEQKKEVMSRF